MLPIEYAKQFISKALTLHNEHANETRVRDNFTSYLRNMFPDNPKWVNYHIEGAETHVHLVRGNRQISGFIDNCIDSIAIEYEKNLLIPSVFDEGYRQVKEYCAALVREGISFELIQGVLSDTLHWHVYEIIPTPGLPTEDYNEDNIVLKEISSFDASSNDTRVVEDFLRFLETYLGRQGGRVITAKRLAEDFGLQSIYSKNYREAIHDYVSGKINDNPTYYNMVEDLWNKFVESHSVENDNTTSYIGEFYITIIAKLLCANLICQNALSSTDDELKDIITGEFFYFINIENFVEYDYFGWLNADIADISDILGSIQDDLKVYDFSKHPQEDMFGELMIQLANREHRLLLGQERTPRWLAKELVNNVVSKLPSGAYPQFVDMCCGSGSMIVETIKATEGLIPVTTDFNTRSQILRYCISGFDIDPLAVILAKINWLINIYDSVNHDEELYIPIYHADSLFIENPITQKSKTEDELYNLVLFDKSIQMPQYAISSEYRNVFDLIVNKCYDCIHVNLAKEDFLEIIKTLIDGFVDGPQLTELSDFAFNLYKVLAQLDAEGKNGIWSFILKNSFRPSLISARFNGIVSNTPWLAMSKIGSNPYKESLKEIASQMAINPTNSSFPHLELATVFLLSSINRYLQEGGAFGCILPDSVLNGGQHTKFRTGNFKKKGIKADFDEIWSLPADTFKNMSIAIFGVKREFNETTQYQGRKYLSKESYTPAIFNVSNVSSKSIWTAEETSDVNSSINKYEFKQGADIMPRCFFFFTLNNTGETVRISSIKEGEDYSYFRKDQKVGKNLTYNVNGVPKSLLKSVLISNVLLPFNMGKLPCAVLPIEKNDNKWQEIGSAKLLSFQRSVINHFNNIKRDYKAIKHKDDMYGNTLNMWNKLELQQLQQGKYLVVYGAGGKNICSAYMLIDNSDKYVIDQTLYWAMVDTEEEAIYLSAILNCPTLNDIIAAFQPQGVFGERHVHTLPIDYIPRYNQEDSRHVELVNKAKILFNELYSELSIDLTDPNKGTLSSRRKKVSNILSSLPSYTLYITLCESILQNTMASESNGDQLRIENESIRLNVPIDTVKGESDIVSMIGPDDESETETIPLYDEYHEGCIPLYTLRAACGYFEDGEVPEEEGWVDASGNGFTPDPKRHFAVHAKGDSMLDMIKDGDICVFEWYRAGSRNGEIVLTECSEKDLDYGGMYTIKKYHSEKLVTEESWQHSKVELIPLNKDFDVIELDEENEYRTIGVLKCVLSNE